MRLQRLIGKSAGRQSSRRGASRQFQRCGVHLTFAAVCCLAGDAESSALGLGCAAARNSNEWLVQDYWGDVFALLDRSRILNTGLPRLRLVAHRLEAIREIRPFLPRAAAVANRCVSGGGAVLNVRAFAPAGCDR